MEQADYQKAEEKKREEIKKMISEGKLPEAHPLTRAQRRELDKSGNNFLKAKAGEKRTFFGLHEDCADYILDHWYKDFDFDGVENNVCLAFADYVYHLTYGDKIAEKN